MTFERWKKISYADMLCDAIDVAIDNPDLNVVLDVPNKNTALIMKEALRYHREYGDSFANQISIRIVKAN